MSEAKEKTDREKQIQAIEDTFRAAKQPPVHPTKPHLRVAQVFGQSCHRLAFPLSFARSCETQIYESLVLIG